MSFLSTPGMSALISMLLSFCAAPQHERYQPAPVAANDGIKRGIRRYRDGCRTAAVPLRSPGSRNFQMRHQHMLSISSRCMRQSRHRVALQELAAADLRGTDLDDVDRNAPHELRAAAAGPRPRRQQAVEVEQRR